jgi:hypothetical protein
LFRNLLDVLNQPHRLFAYTLENMIVALKLDGSGHELDQRIKSLPMGLDHSFLGVESPAHQLLVPGRGKLLTPVASKNFEPNLLTTHTLNEKMVKGFSLDGKERKVCCCVGHGVPAALKSSTCHEAPTT